MPLMQSRTSREPDFTLDEVVEMLNNFEAFSVKLDGDQLVITGNDMMAKQ